MVGGSRVLSRFVQSQIGKKYNICSSDPNHTDCFKMLEEYMSYYDIYFPSEYEDLTIENYGDQYTDSPEETMNKFTLFLSTFLVREPSDRSLPGFVIVLKCTDGSVAIGVDCGNGYVITVSNTNGCVVERKINFEIGDVYRCQLQSQ